MKKQDAYTFIEYITQSSITGEYELLGFGEQGIIFNHKNIIYKSFYSRDKEEALFAKFLMNNPHPLFPKIHSAGMLMGFPIISRDNICDFTTNNIDLDNLIEEALDRLNTYLLTHENNSCYIRDNYVIQYYNNLEKMKLDDGGVIGTINNCIDDFAYNDIILSDITSDNIGLINNNLIIRDFGGIRGFKDELMLEELNLFTKEWKDFKINKKKSEKCFNI